MDGLFSSLSLWIGFRKHVSEVAFVIYTETWAPKFILPHTGPAQEEVSLANKGPKRKQNDSCVSSVVMVKGGGPK